MQRNARRVQYPCSIAIAAASAPPPSKHYLLAKFCRSSVAHRVYLKSPARPDLPLHDRLVTLSTCGCLSPCYRQSFRKAFLLMRMPFLGRLIF